MSKTYLIVGGTSGIGAALLGKLVARGHRVIQLSRHPQAAPDHPAVTSLHWDVRTNDFPADALPATLDGLVYCPGTIRLRPFERLAEKEWTEDLEINLLGAVRALQGAMKALKAAESASIVLFSTVAVGTGLPFHASIASAKGAVEGLTRSLAAELAPRIRVNAVAPTLTATPLAERLLGNESKRTAAAERHPLRTIGEPEDVAGAALWLLEDARMTTGQVIRVDAGLATLRST
jgi:NAD(P)-dependent dehydrogenase (short-subunit alcohol dehydrogenase family)